MPSGAYIPRQQVLENLEAHVAVQDDRAARTVAGRAKDSDDCRLLLEMLGLGAGDRVAGMISRSGPVQPVDGP
jgi:hypothetical protein